MKCLHLSLHNPLIKSCASRCKQLNRFLIRSLSQFSSQSRNSFDDYEKERALFKAYVPSKFNFAADVLDKWADEEKRGERKKCPPAFWYLYESGAELKWSFQKLQEESKKTANFLQSQCQLGRQDGIMVILPKVPEFWLVNIAAIRVGCVLSPGSMQLTAKDIKYRLSAFKPKCIVAEESVVAAIDSVADSCESLKTKVIVSDKVYRENGWLDFRSLQREESSSHQCADTDSHESMMIFFTSGTSGYPKMVEHTHSSYGIGLANTAKYWYDLTKENVLWTVSDTGWAKTAYGSFFAPWSQGSCVFVHQMFRFNPVLTLDILQKFPVDTFCAPPTAYNMLLKELNGEPKFSKLTHCLSAGEAMNPDVIRNWIKATGLKIYEGYGQTETVCLLGMFKCLNYKPGSIGKPPPGAEIKILDESGKELGPGEEGEICLIRNRCQYIGLFKRYKCSAEKTAAQMTETTYRTGDVGYCDDDGFFWFVGRNDDLINSAGYRIGPFEVESALMEHPAVVDVAVTSSPDHNRGEVVKAFVVLEESYLTKDERQLTEDLQNFVKKITAPYKYPRKIEFIKEIPKTISGKTRRAELRKQEWSKKI